MRTCAFWVTLVFSLCQYGLTQALGTGQYDHGSFDNLGFDTINVGNLNVHFEIPIVSKPGRGQSFRYSIVYDGMIWAASGEDGNHYWLPDASWGFHGQQGENLAGYVSYDRHLGVCSDEVTVIADAVIHRLIKGFIDRNYIFYDSVGRRHLFNYTYNECTHATSGDGMTSDGSGYGLRYGSAVVTRDGSTISVPIFSTSTPDGFTGISSVTDANGNVIRNNGDGTFTDTLGVTALAISGDGNASSPRVFTYKVANQSDSSATASVVMSYHTYAVQTNFGCTDSAATPIGQYASYAVDLVDRITLADGTYYQFAYENTPGISGAVTGRLAFITLPTGGTIAYQYSGGCNGNGLNADGTIGSLSRTTMDGTRNYLRAPTTGGSKTSLQDEKGSWSLYQFVTANDAIYETHRQVYQGGIGDRQLLDRYKCYNGMQAPCDGSALSMPITEVATLTSYNGGSQVGIDTMYDSAGMPTSVRKFGATGTLQTVATSYNSLEEPTGVSAMDGSGTPMTFTWYGYDESALVSTSGIPQHDGLVSGPRGNLTSTHVSAGSTYIDTTTAYYDTGAPFRTSTSNGTTERTYDATQTWVTTTSLPTPSSGIGLATGASYETQSGAQLSVTGLNNEQTQITQYDRLLRPAIISFPDGGQIKYERPSANVVWKITTMENGKNAVTVSETDGYGRLRRTAVLTGQSDLSKSWYQVDYCYDAAGLLRFRSNRYVGSGFTEAIHCTVDGTSYTYDALGRTTAVSNADGTASTEYFNRAVKTTDVNQVQRITQFDLLGRISTVCEITSNNTMPNSGSPESCGSDIPGSGFKTNYYYSLTSSGPNRVTTIQQGTRTRSFQIDPAGRLSQTVEPERGTTNYSYAYNNIGLVVTRTRGRANQTNSSITTNTVTQYDRVGRPVSVSYNDGTPTKTFYYDAAGNWPSNFSQSNLKGRLAATSATAQNYNSSTAYDYDPMGRVSKMVSCLPTLCGDQAHNHNLLFGYDLAGNLTFEADGASGTIAYGRSLAGEVTSITNLSYQDTYNPANLVSGIQNGPTGPTLYNLGNGKSIQNWYDSMGRRYQQVLCNTADASNCYNRQWYGTFSGTIGSRVVVQCDTINDTACRSYGYDDLNRLTAINSATDSYSYTYDRYGNRWSQNVTGGQGISHQDSYANSSTNQMDYRTYDAAGNMINDATHTYSYDAEGNLTQVDGGMTAVNNYDSMNHRVYTQTASFTYGWLYDYADRRVSGWLLPIDFGNQGRIYWDGKQIAYRAWNGRTYFQHQDILGTDRARTDYTGAMASTYISLPWGDGYNPTETSNVGDGLDPIHFAGLDHDTESNTDHAQFRQYSSAQGRWMSPDPYDGSYDMGDPQSFNRYSYVLNKPLNFADPMGLDCSTSTSTGCSVDVTTTEPWVGDGSGNGNVHPPELPIAPEDGGSYNGPVPAPDNTVTQTAQPKSPARQQCETNAAKSYSTAIARANQDGLRSWGRDVIGATVGGIVGGCATGAIPSGGTGCPIGGLVGGLGGLVGGTLFGGIDGGLTAYWGRERAGEDYATMMQQCSQVP